MAKRGGKAAVAESDASEPANEDPVLIGVGASAGGLAALTQFLDALPASANVAVIVVQHLEPHHKSRLSQLLAKSSPMPVNEAEDGQKIEPHRVYVIPPNADLEFKDNRLRVLERKEGQSRLAVIDKFFQSLAEGGGARTMGIILSGTGSDGTAGLRAIKEAGGITFAQESDSAAYSGMPDSAVRANVVDVVLKPAAIAAEVVQLLKHPYVGPAVTLDEQLDQDIPNMSKVHMLLQSGTGVDFRDYKPSTFKRRLLRRMALHDVRDLTEYIEFLRKDRNELNQLYSDALIKVTSFFREPETFSKLGEVFVKELMADPKQEVRVWIAGCSTGEEVYSYAIALLEAAGEKSHPKIQFFATDVNEENVAAARQGLYKDSAVADLPPEIRRRYFTQSDDTFQVIKRIRDMCVFSVHNVYRDPPFSNMDLVSCRNLLIYLRTDAQKRALTAFHYALKKKGVLVLGTSESTGVLGEFFTQSDIHLPIFDKRDKPLPLAYTLFRTPIDTPRPTLEPRKADAVRDTFPARIQKALLHRFVPPGAIVDRNGEVLEFLGQTSEFFEAAPGRASLNVFKMARHGLELDLRAVLMKAHSSGAAASRLVRWKQGDKENRLEVEALPLDHGEAEEVYVISFQSVPLPPGKFSSEELTGTENLAELEAELQQTRDQLQSTVEQYETTTEELRTSNEEALSINEELQSTNEELQTTAEELQSANEELSTLNEELQYRNNDLTRANGDLENLLSSVRFPIVFLGDDMTIRRFTPAAGDRLRLLTSDIGRPLGDLRIQFGVDDLTKKIQDVIDQVRPIEQEVQDENGNWSLLRVQPYRTMDNRIKGAVLILIDINELKKARDELERSNQDLHQFAAFTSHELRAPLRNAKLYLGMVKRAVDDGELENAAKDLTLTADNLDRMLRLVNSLLMFSEVKDDETDRGVVDLSQALEEAQATLGSEVQDPKCTVTINGEMPNAIGDAELIGVVFTNIIANAIHHNDGAVNIEFSAVKSGDEIEIRCVDDGQGIGGLEASQLFELFKRGSREKHDGLGLGLAICRRVVEAHGGRIWAPANKDGFELRLTLPAAK